MKKSLALLAAVLSMLAADSMEKSQACCSLHPADFSSTIGYAGETMRNGKVVHLLGYQNDVENKNKSGGNAMLLPIPAVKGSMSRANVLDTEKAKNILDDMKAAVMRNFRSRGMVVGAGELTRGAAPVEVFEHDIYTIVLAQKASDIPGAMSQVPEKKRPALNKEIFDAYEKWYPGWTFALCCFNNEDKSKASPMLWWYEPSNVNELFFPALDAHDGKPPNLNNRVEVDHVLISSSTALRQAAPPSAAREPEPFAAVYPPSQVRYTDSLPADLKALLPRLVIGAPNEGSI